MIRMRRTTSALLGGILACGLVLGVPAAASAAEPPPPNPYGKGTGGGGTLSDGSKSYMLACSLYNGIQEMRGDSQRICGMP
jgi:hypothetical protein